MLDVTTFQYHNSKSHKVRTIQKKDESVWFVAVDVCKVLGLKNSSVTMQTLDNDERAKFNLGRQGEAWIVNESGLYALIMNSRKPAAKKFRKWVTSEVLPQIRQTGSYNTTLQDQKPVSSLAVTAFLQATMDTFWNIDKAILKHQMSITYMNKAKRDVAIIVRSIRGAFPECKKSVDMIGGIDKTPLEVELR